MDYTLFPLFFVSTLLLELSPGPAVFLVIGHGMKFGLRGAMLGALGIEIINGSYFFLSAIGLTSALLAYPTVFMGLQWAGITYLIFTGVQIFFSAKERPLTYSHDIQGSELIGQGIMTQISNPKAIIYYSAMLPQFVNTEKSLGLQMTVLGSVSCGMEFMILTIYGWLAFKGSQYLPGPKAILWQDRIAGICLIAVALVLLLK